DLGRGAIVVGFRQQVGGHDVVHGDVKVMLDRQHRLLAIAGSPHPEAVAKTARKFAQRAFALEDARAQQTAVATALRDLYGQDFSPSALRSGARPPRAGWHYLELAPLPGPVREELTFAEPARVRPVYFPLAGRLVPAHSVELQVRRTPTSELDVFHYVIAAEPGHGQVLLRSDLTAYDAYSYLVWADKDGDLRPKDGPLQDFTPHPTGLPDVGPAGPTKPVMVTVEGLNHNPDGVADPWLPPGSVETIGNHVDAYVDHTDPDGLQPDNGEFRAQVTAPGVFELDYNVDAEPLSSPEQSQAALVQLFYTINWLHDWWYDSGFVEATGVAQADNFGRGGIDGDRMRAEGQDGALTGKRNNANMSTPSDGASPRMQMYLWSPRINVGSLTIFPGELTYEVKKAQFGPLVFDVQAPLVLVDDGEGSDPHDGCEAPKNDLAGKIVLIHRGSCTFETKTVMAEAAGALGVLISNHMNDGLPPLGADNETEDPTIPVLGLTLADGQAIEAVLGPDTTA
ncbi:MAG TPA: M36 family metallopeptidase, partial [Nannocystis sp.]